ncbi:MAG: hypothetical protein KGI97_07745, partial [Alphaproteobacteria bacterium]|nr:hypothetical protein [Alphaproteobacteria bacterium]
MKKFPFKKKLQALFWVLFALACLWLAFVPPRHRPLPPPAHITVKVQPPVLPPSALTTGGEEKTPHLMPSPQLPPPQMPQPQPPSPQTGITVPVTPEAEHMPPAGEKPEIAIVV